MRRTLLATVSALAVMMLPAHAAAQTAGDFVADYEVKVTGAGFDGSVVAQPLPGGSVMSLAKHGWGPGGTTTVRLIDPSGGVAWVTTIAEPQGGGFYGSEYRESLALPDGRVAFVGYSDSRFLTAIQPDGHDFDAVILVISPDGSYEHVAQFGGPGQDFLRVIEPCPDGTIYVGGSSWDHSVAPSETSAIGMSDNFVARFDANFNRMWVRQFGSRNNDAIMSLRCRADGGVDVNAWAAGAVNGHGSNDHYNFLTVRMSASGETVRTIVSELDGGEWSPQGGVTAPDGSYYVVGESNSTYPSLPCTERSLGGSFLAKYSPDGELEWRSILACANTSHRVAVDSHGNLLVAGTAHGKRIAGQQRLGGSDHLLHKFSPDGTRLWTRQFGTGEDDVVSSFALDDSGGVVLGGYTLSGQPDESHPADWDAVTMRLSVAEAAPAAVAPSAAQCEPSSTTMLADSVTPRSIWIYGDDIGEARMAALWEYASTHTPHDFGRLIGAAHDWFGSCRHAGIGLGTGSGYSWHDRNVVLWVWTEAVDMTVARRVVADLIDSLVPPVPTTVAPATTAPATVETVAAPGPVTVAEPGPPGGGIAMSTGQGPSVLPAGQPPQGSNVVTAAPGGTPAAAKSPSGKSSARKVAPRRKPAPKRKPTARTARPTAVRGLGVQRG